jgi:hypothetical protein
MAKRILVIDSNDQAPFCLRSEAGALLISDNANEPGVVLRDLRISRICCEVEVEEDVVVVGEPPDGQELRLGQSLLVGHAHLRFEPTLPESKPAPTAPDPKPPAPAAKPAPAPPAPAAVGQVFKQLLVFDGADRGATFRLPEAGCILIGNSAKHAELVLHDLYVSRVHCEVDVRDDRVYVTHCEGKKGTLINGQPITGEQELRFGDVLRVGNSHIRLETAVASDEPEAEETGDDVEVVEEETEGALAVASGDGAARPVAPEESVSSGQPALDRLRQLEGQVLGQYRIGSLIGRGHSGLIFRAQHLKTNLVVALKVLSGDFPASGEELQRFVGALKVASGIPHANLVTYYGAGRSGPYCWIAREYIEGESAARMIQALKDGGTLGWMRAGQIALHLGRALACLYEHRIVHLNVTPRNILIRSSDRTTKLADLMLVQSLQGSRLQSSIAEKKMHAELPYLAPEKTDPGSFVDHLADLYAVGAVVYALLTGRPPFVGHTPEETRTLIREAKLVRPTNFQRSIPGPFEAVVMKLLARNQEDRYQTPTELLADLEPIIDEDDEG